MVVRKALYSSHEVHPLVVGPDCIRRSSSQDGPGSAAERTPDIPPTVPGFHRWTLDRAMEFQAGRKVMVGGGSFRAHRTRRGSDLRARDKADHGIARSAGQKIEHP